MAKHPPDYYGDLKSCVTADSVYLLWKIELDWLPLCFCNTFDIDFPLFNYFSCIFFSS